MWWVLLLRGIALLIFGVIAVLWPAISFIALAVLFAIFILVSGVLNLLEGIMNINTDRYWFLLLVLGIIEIGAGVYAINNPGIQLAALALLIGLTFVVRGIMEIISIFFGENFDGSNRLLMLIGSALSILAGIVVLRYPIEGGIAFTWILGVYALIAGCILVAISFSARNLSGEIVSNVDIPVKKGKTGK